MGIYRIISNEAQFDQFPSERTPLDPEGKPVLPGYRDPVSFHVFSPDVIECLKPKSHLIRVLFKIRFPLCDVLQVLGQEFDEITHIGLVDLLACKGLDLRIVDGEAKFEEAEG